MKILDNENIYYYYQKINKNITICVKTNNNKYINIDLYQYILHKSLNNKLKDWNIIDIIDDKSILNIMNFINLNKYSIFKYLYNLYKTLNKPRGYFDNNLTEVNKLYSIEFLNYIKYNYLKYNEIVSNTLYNKNILNQNVNIYIKKFIKNNILYLINNNNYINDYKKEIYISNYVPLFINCNLNILDNFINIINNLDKTKNDELIDNKNLYLKIINLFKQNIINYLEYSKDINELIKNNLNYEYEL